MECEDLKDEKPENDPSLGHEAEDVTTHQKQAEEQGAVDEECTAVHVKEDGNGAAETNRQAQGSNKKAVPPYQRIDKNFLKAALPKIVKLSRTEIAQDIRVLHFCPQTCIRMLFFSLDACDTLCQLAWALLMDALTRYCR